MAHQLKQIDPRNDAHYKMMMRARRCQAMVELHQILDEIEVPYFGAPKIVPITRQTHA